MMIEIKCAACKCHLGFSGDIKDIEGAQHLILVAPCKVCFDAYNAKIVAIIKGKE